MIDLLLGSYQSISIKNAIALLNPIKDLRTLELNYFCNLLHYTYMIKQHFYVFSIGTIIYAWFFADALFTGQYFLTGFWSLLLMRKAFIAYKADKWIRLHIKN